MCFILLENLNYHMAAMSSQSLKLTRCIVLKILTLLSLKFLQVRIPDVEFFINLGDWPLEKRSAEDSPLPILSWCGSEETRDIVMPTYDVTESTLETMGR